MCLSALPWLRWHDVNGEAGRGMVWSPKAEAHLGGDGHAIPLFMIGYPFRIPASYPGLASPVHECSSASDRQRERGHGGRLVAERVRVRVDELRELPLAGLVAIVDVKPIAAVEDPVLVGWTFTSRSTRIATAPSICSLALWCGSGAASWSDLPAASSMNLSPSVGSEL